jgi:hypothetical protein
MTDPVFGGNDLAARREQLCGFRSFSCQSYWKAVGRVGDRGPPGRRDFLMPLARPRLPRSASLATASHRGLQAQIHRHHPHTPLASTHQIHRNQLDQRLFQHTRRCSYAHALDLPTRLVLAKSGARRGPCTATQDEIGRRSRMSRASTIAAQGESPFVLALLLQVEEPNLGAPTLALTPKTLRSAANCDPFPVLGGDVGVYQDQSASSGLQ